MRRMGIGLQLYTLRDETAHDFKGTLRKVAELGCEGVEFAGYGGIPADEMKALLDELGLKAIGAHVGIHLLRDNLEQEISYLKTIGASYIICPYVSPDERGGEAEWKERFELFRKVGAEARRNGLVFAYHNHDFEFTGNVGDSMIFDALYEATSPEDVQVELDVCWVQFAKQDPLAYIAKYAGRLPLLHLKDFSREADGSMKTLQLGLGEVDLLSVISASSDAGVDWLIVEQDHCQIPPLESVANSMNWVQEHYLKQF